MRGGGGGGGASHDDGRGVQRGGGQFVLYSKNEHS